MSPSGGSELNAVRTVEQLVQRGLEPLAFTLRDEGGMRERYEAAGVAVHAFPLRSLVDPSALASARQMARVLRAQGAQLIHAHDSYSNLVGTIAARLAGIPSIASKRWTVNPQGRHLWTNRFAYRLATRVLANSETVRTTAIRDEWIAPSRVFVINNFVDDRLLVPEKSGDRERLRAEFEFSPSDLVVCCVARLRPEKDHETLLRAFADVVAKVPEARLLLVGDGAEERTLRNSAAQLGLEDVVRFAGHRADASTVHRAGDVSVLSSLHEGFPNTIVEAMASGRPVVATCVGGVVDAVVDGQTGLLVPPRNSTALADAILRLLRSSDLRVRFGSSGQERASKHFSSSAVIDRLVAQYHHLVGMAA